MRRLVSFLVVIPVAVGMASSSAAAGQRGAAAAGAAPAALERQVLDASTAWADALYRNDVDALENLLADDFVTIQMTGTGVALIEKAVQLEVLRRAGADRPRAVRTLDRVRVRSYGGTVAVLTAVATYKGEAASGPAVTTQAVISEVWVNQAGRWQLSHFQPTPVVRATPAPAPGR